MSSVVRINMKTDEEEKKMENASLMERWRHHKSEREKMGGPDHFIWDKCVKCLITFQAPTQVYVSVNYIIPALFADYDDWTIYYLKVFIWFIWIQEVANYICTKCFDSSYTKTQDRPNLVGLNDRWNNPPDHFLPYDSCPRQQNGHANHFAGDQRDDGGIPWQYCESSAMYIPPRSHYCKICKKCILKRDHHCYVVGTCIGYKNQRYFVVLTFYTVLVGLLGGYWTSRYLINVYWPEAISWTDFLPPFAFYRMVFGIIPLHIGIMVFHVYIEFLFGIVGFFFFNSQISLIAKGKTLFELAQDISVKSNNSINSNFVSVFGNFWLLNFLFPMVLILPQLGDGTKWDGVKLDYNDKK